MSRFAFLTKRCYRYAVALGITSLLLHQVDVARNVVAPYHDTKNRTELPVLPFARLSNTSLPLDVLSNTTRELEQALKKQQQEVNQHQEHPHGDNWPNAMAQQYTVVRPWHY